MDSIAAVNETRQDEVLRWSCFAIGVGALAAGMYGINSHWSQPGWIGCFFVGTLLLVIAVFAPRITSLSLRAGPDGVSADVAMKVGIEMAKELRNDGIMSLVESYAFIHHQLSDDRFRDAKVVLQDALVDKVSSTAFKRKPNASAVKHLLRSGSAAERVLALGFLKGDPALRTVELLVPSILEPQSGNEQYHAMWLAKEAWPQMNEADRKRIVKAVEDRPYNDADTDRGVLAAQILAMEGS